MKNKQNKSVIAKSEIKQKADELRRKAIRTENKTNKFVNKWIEQGKKDPKLRNSKLMEQKYNKLSKEDTKAYKEYRDYVHANFSGKSISDSMNACLKNDINRKNRGFMSKSFINRLR